MLSRSHHAAAIGFNYVMTLERGKWIFSLACSSITSPNLSRGDEKGQEEFCS